MQIPATFLIPRVLFMLISLCLVTGCESDSTEDPSGSESNETDEELGLAPESDSEPESEPEFAAAPEGKVLRHTVFFSFNEESTEEDVQGVVDAFRALPSRISEIIDFEWGVNNSPEGLDDGFTHCFILTFADEAGRAAYLPHEAHKDFGDVLRPHMKDVFVIDYWGDKDMAAVESPLRHAVFFRFKSDAAEADVKNIEEAFAALPGKIEEIKAFEWGINNSPEKHDDGFTHCFFVTFDSDAGREAYLPHPEHKAFVEILGPVLDAPRVLDFNAAK